MFFVDWVSFHLDWPKRVPTAFCHFLRKRNDVYRNFGILKTHLVFAGGWGEGKGSRGVEGKRGVCHCTWTRRANMTPIILEGMLALLHRLHGCGVFC